MEAYVLITIAAGKVEPVLKEVSVLAEAKRTDSVTGPFDAIALIEAESFDEIGKIVVDKIQKIEGVTRTLTCLVTKF